MTTLIYRGVTHEGHQKIRTRVAQDLIYRGVPHDGLCREAPSPSRSIMMRYRGAAYSLAMGAAHPDRTTASDETGQFTPAHAFA